MNVNLGGEKQVAKEREWRTDAILIVIKMEM